MDRGGGSCALLIPQDGHDFIKKLLREIIPARLQPRHATRQHLATRPHPAPATIRK